MEWLREKLSQCLVYIFGEPSTEPVPSLLSVSTTTSGESLFSDGSAVDRHSFYTNSDEDSPCLCGCEDICDCGCKIGWCPHAHAIRNYPTHINHSRPVDTVPPLLSTISQGEIIIIGSVGSVD